MATTEERAGAPPRLARAAVLAVFFVNGAGLAAWLSRIPAIKDGLGAGEGALGLALLGGPAGLLLALAPMSALLVRYGSKRMTMCAGLAYCAALPLPGFAPSLPLPGFAPSLPLPGFAPSLPLLGAALVALGATTGAMDLSMNAQAVGVEKAYGRPILSSVHGMFSAGPQWCAPAGRRPRSG